MKVSSKHVFNGILVVLLTAYVATALGYNEQARMLPLIIGVPVWIMAIYQLAIDLWAEFRNPAKGERGSQAVTVGPERGVLWRSLREFLWVIGAFASLYLVGFCITTLVYTFLYLRLRSKHDWLISLGVPLGAMAFIYVVMIQALQVQLYEGILVLALRRALYGY